ncbi:MAG: PAS domain S-box protein [Asgard group archaeon]|nr:PAS domain S-box protein [Asgard group archaeon]
MTKADKKKESPNVDSKRSNRSSDKEVEKQIKELELKLSESERKSLSLFELTNDAIFLIDTNGVYIDVNQKAAEMLGWNRHDMIGKHMLSFIADEEQDKSKQVLIDILAGKILPIYIRKFKRRDGSIFYAEINAAVVQDKEGKPAYIQSAVRNITERIKVEQSLDKERQVFHLIAEATIYSTNITDLCSRVLTGIAKIMDFEAASLQIYDKETNMLNAAAFINFNESKKIPIRGPISIDNPNFIFTLAARNKREIISTRFEDRSTLTPFMDDLQKDGIDTIITWPILDGKEELLAVIQLASFSPKEIHNDDIESFKTFTRMFSLALEKIRAEEAVKLSEEKYRSFAQNFKGIAYRTKIDWIPVFFNGDVEEITGYTSEELVSWNPRWQDIIHKDDHEIVLDLGIKLEMIPGYIMDTEYRIIRKDGQTRWVQDVSQNICDENKKPIYVQGAIYDISERKRSENIQTIQRNLGISLSTIISLEKALELVLENVCKIGVIECGSVYVIDKETGFLNVVKSIGLSEEFIEEIAFYSTESPFTKSILTGEPIFSDSNDITTLDNNEFILKEDLHALAFIPLYSNDHVVAIFSLGSKTSDTIPLSTRKSLDVIVSQIEGAIARVNAEAALLENAKSHQTFLQNFQGIAYRKDISASYIFLEGAVKEITGYKTEVILSEKVTQKDIIHPYDFDVVQEKVMNSLQKPDEIVTIEYRIITKDGEICWVQDSWQVLKDKNNNLIGFQGSIHNISDRIQVQNELQKLSQDLEQRVEERTAQLELVNKELEAFSYSVSHDLRTPVRHMMDFAKILEKRVSQMDNPDTRVLENTQRIIDSAEEMNELIDGLLTFSRMSSVEMVKIKINLTELVQEVLKNYDVEMANRKVDLKLNILPDVLGDPTLLRLILNNLVANALKFTKNKEVTEIEIGTIPSKEPGKVSIFVRDNGTGFDMKYYDKLFGVFQRLHKKDDFEGTGIGLATVQRVIRRMGGEIWAEGEIDKGATFYFSIPKFDNNDKPNQ